jgi:hypothetical protein
LRSTQNKAQAKQRNAEPALKGWFSGFGKRSAREEPWPHFQGLLSKMALKFKIIPAEIIIYQIILTLNIQSSNTNNANIQ